LTLLRGRAADQLPRRGPDLAGVALVLGHGTTADGSAAQEFLDEYLRTTRRARQAFERTFGAG